MILNYPITRSTLANVYRLSPKTLKSRLRDIGIKHRHTLTPDDIRTMVNEFGLPDGIEIKWGGK